MWRGQKLWTMIWVGVLTSIVGGLICWFVLGGGHSGVRIKFEFQSDPAGSVTNP